MLQLVFTGLLTVATVSGESLQETQALPDGSPVMFTEDDGTEAEGIIFEGRYVSGKFLQDDEDYEPRFVPGVTWHGKFFAGIQTQLVDGQMFLGLDYQHARAAVGFIPGLVNQDEFQSGYAILMKFGFKQDLGVLSQDYFSTATASMIGKCGLPMSRVSSRAMAILKKGARLYFDGVINSSVSGDPTGVKINTSGIRTVKEEIEVFQKENPKPTPSPTTDSGPEVWTDDAGKEQCVPDPSEKTPDPEGYDAAPEITVEDVFEAKKQGELKITQKINPWDVKDTMLLLSKTQVEALVKAVKTKHNSKVNPGEYEKSDTPDDIQSPEIKTAIDSKINWGPNHTPGSKLPPGTLKRPPVPQPISQ